MYSTPDLQLVPKKKFISFRLTILYGAVARYRRFGLADTAGVLLTTYPASYYAVAPVEDLEVAKAIHNSGVPSFRVKRQGNVFIRHVTRNRHRKRIQNIAGRK